MKIRQLCQGEADSEPIDSQKPGARSQSPVTSHQTSVFSRKPPAIRQEAADSRIPGSIVEQSDARAEEGKLLYEFSGVEATFAFYVRLVVGSYQ